MSALDLDALEARLWAHAKRGGGCIAVPEADLDALITRLRAAESRADWLRASMERVVKRCAEGGEQALAEAQCALNWDDDALPAAPGGAHV